MYITLVYEVEVISIGASYAESVAAHWRLKTASRGLSLEHAA